MTKELVLVAVAVVSILLAVLTISRIRKADMSKRRKIGLSYLTILAPVIGFFLVNSRDEKSS